jgi:hypothetical protein
VKDSGRRLSAPPRSLYFAAMKRLLFSTLLLLLFLPALAFADDTVRCESKDGHRRRCSFDGPGRVTLEKQLSITACTEGESWGWRPGEIWVDDGCRADFRIERRRDRDEDRYDDPGDDHVYRGRDRDRRLIVCESDGHRRRCPAEIRYGVELTRQLSKRDCIRDDTWGWDENGVWVDRGCRAEFAIRAPRRRDDHRRGEIVVCESRDERKHFCAVDTTYGVELRKQLSVSDCKYRDTWGYGDRGIWVKDGCRAEFFVRGR